MPNTVLRVLSASLGASAIILLGSTVIFNYHMMMKKMGLRYSELLHNNI